MEIAVIGIGPGNPEQVTIEAIRTLNACDLVLIPQKGDEKAELAGLRREICRRYLENPATRLVAFDLPERAAAGSYRAAVDDWHRAIAATYRDLLAREARPGARVALLVWGDPSLYDSTLRILALLGELGVAFSVRVVPGVTSLQALAARHAMPLNAIAGEIAVTTGRRLRAAVPAAETIAVMLDGDCAFETLPGADWTIAWAAYLGMDGEIAVAGPLDAVAGRIRALRDAARAERGWIMDSYVLRRRTKPGSGGGAA